MACLGTFPFLWATLAILMQIVQVFSPLSPFVKLDSELDYFLPDLNRLLDDVSHDWRTLELQNLSDKQIAAKIKKYNRIYTLHNERYMTGKHFPVSKSCNDKAQNDVKWYIKNLGGDSSALI